jgi:hypothetical protein
VADASAEKLSPVAIGVLAVVGVAGVAGLCAIATHQGCFHPGPPVSRPEPGTPRGEYCDALNAAYPWLSLTIVPGALMALAACGARKWPRVVAGIALFICLLLIANAAVANSLSYSLTI